MSKIAVSPVTTWSFCVTTTEPLASSRRIDELPPGPGVADCIGPDFDPFGAAGAGVGRRRAGIVEHHQRFRGHGGVALHDLHIAGEGRFLFLVAHFERGRLDLNRLVAVLRKALHRIRHARHGALRQGVTGGDQRERKRRGRKTAREELHHRFHFVLADLPVTDRVFGGGAGSGSGSAPQGFP